MSFNQQFGEPIENLGGGYRVVPLAKWADTELWTQAAEAAAQAFVNSGALFPVQFTDILVQEYPKTNKLCFLFEATVKGKPMFYPYVWSMKKDMIAEFVNTGRWQPHTEH